MRILIVGFSTRAFAESAIRMGYNVVTLDYFGDRDQKELVENYSLKRDFQLNFNANALLRATHALKFDAITYTSNLENHPQVIEEFFKGKLALGNSAFCLSQVRNWGHLRLVCKEENIAYPPTLLSGEEQKLRKSKGWLIKPIMSGAGHGIRFWRGEKLDKRHIIQKWINGKVCSAVFVSDGQRCALLGLTEQLIGRKELGARGFAWCGNIFPLSIPTQERETVIKLVRKMVEVLTNSYGLQGVNGIDFILARDKKGLKPYLIEVNPRYTASMELVEWAYKINIFDIHLDSFNGKLPNFHLEEHLSRCSSSFFGKAIVYAKREKIVPNTDGWKEKGRRDIPFSGECIFARHPICTVLAQGKSRDECWCHLLEAAEAVQQEISF